MFRLYRIASFTPARKPFQIDLQFKVKNSDFGAISVTERSCAWPILKMERHISDRFCPILWRSVNRYSDRSGSEEVGIRTRIPWDRSKYSGLRTGILFTRLSADCPGMKFDVCERLVPVLCRCCSHYPGCVSTRNIHSLRSRRYEINGRKKKRTREETRVSRHVSPSRAPVLSCAHFLAPATQAKTYTDSS